MMEWKPNGTSAPIIKTSNLIVLLEIFKAFKKERLHKLCDVRIYSQVLSVLSTLGTKYAKRMQMNIKTINDNNAVKY